MNQRFVAGMHGYAPEHVDSKACWLTNAKLDRHPDSICDIFDVMVQQTGEPSNAISPDSLNLSEAALPIE